MAGRSEIEVNAAVQYHAQLGHGTLPSICSAGLGPDAVLYSGAL